MGGGDEMEEKISAKQYLAHLSAKHYQAAWEAKQRGELVAWSSSIAPQELCETMGIYVLYPENHAAAIGAKGGALPLIQKAEAMGYAADICSYARINLAYTKEQECCFENIPLPDLLIICNNICNTVIKWYENLAKELNIPLICIDVPFNNEYEVTPARIRYIKGQFDEAIRQLEEITGRSFDYDRFREVMEISNATARAWNKAMQYAQCLPSPLNGFNIFNYMAMMVCNRGRKEAAELFEMIASELEELHRSGRSQFAAEQQYRVMWEGIACWPYLSHNFQALKQYGINFVGSTYPEAWTLLYEVGDLDGMARAYASVMNNCNLQRAVDLRVKIIEECRCDGAIYHLNRSCKLMSLTQYQLAREVFRRTGVPYVVFDGDQTDPRVFAKGQFETRLQGLVEMMSGSKVRDH